jgi:hypothetical protein
MSVIGQLSDILEYLRQQTEIGILPRLIDIEKLSKDETDIEHIFPKNGRDALTKIIQSLPVSFQLNLLQGGYVRPSDLSYVAAQFVANSITTAVLAAENKVLKIEEDCKMVHEFTDNIYHFFQGQAQQMTETKHTTPYVGKLIYTADNYKLITELGTDKIPHESELKYTINRWTKFAEGLKEISNKSAEADTEINAKKNSMVQISDILQSEYFVDPSEPPSTTAIINEYYRIISKNLGVKIIETNDTLISFQSTLLGANYAEMVSGVVHVKLDTLKLTGKPVKPGTLSVPVGAFF